MNTHTCLALLIVTAITLSHNAFAQDINLPAPKKTGGKPLFEAITERISTKDYSDKEITRQELSNILWSAYGFNRDDKRVIPTSGNHQHLSVYVFLKDAVYLYEAKANKLIKKADGDHRRKVGGQDFVYITPVNILYVADGSKNVGTDSHISVGCAAQDVYLACTSLGLGTVVRTGGINADEARRLLKLADTDEPIAAQTVGHAKNRTLSAVLEGK